MNSVTICLASAIIQLCSPELSTVTLDAGTLELLETALLVVSETRIQGLNEIKRVRVFDNRFGAILASFSLLTLPLLLPLPLGPVLMQ